MKNKLKILVISLAILLIAALVWFFYGRGNPNALWQIVSEQCVPNQKQNNLPKPCIKIDLEESYALFKDSKGPYHDLVIPTQKISGIESPLLQSESLTSYFLAAWKNRSHISTEMNKPLKDSWISLAVNSEYGRSQNQLHVHIACLRQDVYNALNEQEKKINQYWRPLPIKLVGNIYLARKLSGTDLTKEDPFHLLKRYADEQGDNIGNYGLALAINPRGEMLLLATRVSLKELNLGSAGELQDYQCKVAGN